MMTLFYLTTEAFLIALLSHTHLEAAHVQACSDLPDTEQVRLRILGVKGSRARAWCVLVCTKTLENVL